MRTADDRTNSTGHYIDGANSVYLSNHSCMDGYETLKKSATQLEDRLLEAIEMTVWDLNSTDTLPRDAETVAGYLLSRGADTSDVVKVEVYQRYTIDSKTKERRPARRGRRTVVYHKGVRHQSIRGHVFVGSKHL